MPETSATDPRGWLEQLPGLERFAGDGPIGAAVASGDARRLAEALRARRSRPRNPAEVAVIDRLLAVRRAFVIPVTVTRSPTLFAHNGIGGRIYGASDKAPDGSYIGTLFATIIFLPVWPLAQYLLKPDGKQYTFLGEVPLSPTMRLWRRLAGAAALAGLLVAAGIAFERASHAEVQLLNGLDVPVTVTAGPERVDLAPGQRTTRRMSVGATTFRAEAGGVAIEEVKADIPRFHDLVTYSVAGAASLVLVPVVYTAKDSRAKPVVPTSVPLVGAPFVTRRNVDHLFREPPQSVKLERSSKQAIRWHLPSPKGGWRLTVDYLRGKGEHASAAEVAAKVARAQPDDLEALHRALQCTRTAGGLDAALEVARRAAEARPDQPEVQRALAALLLGTGRADEARRIFGERAAREPGSALAAYLQARVAPHREGLRLLTGALQRFPDDPWLRRSYAWHLIGEGRDAEALVELQRASRLAPGIARDAAPLEAHLLARLGRAPEAARRLLAVAADRPSPREAVLYARAARLAGGAAPRPAEALLAALPDEPPVRTFAQALAAAGGEEPPAEKELARIPDAVALAAARIHAAAQREPRQALALLKAASPEAVEAVDPELVTLLAAEALVAGDEPLAQRLLASETYVPELPPAVQVAFLRGGPATDLEDLDPWKLAALHAGRARVARAAGRPYAADERRARELDALRGPPTSALQRWPAPRR